MNRLSPEERRRVFLVQQRARERMLARLSAPTVSTVDQGGDQGGHRRLLLTAVVMGAMLVGSVLASQALEFHPPASLIEAILPRL